MSIMKLEKGYIMFSDMKIQGNTPEEIANRIADDVQFWGIGDHERNMLVAQIAKAIREAEQRGRDTSKERVIDEVHWSASHWA